MTAGLCPHRRPADGFCARCDEEKAAKAKPKPAKPVPPAVPLTDLERAKLGELETVVERGIGTFMEVGTALMEIRAARLYRDDFKTWEEYCKGRWTMTGRHANRLIESAEVSAAFAEMGPMGPKTERQARELLPLRDDPTAMVEAFAEASSEAAPTAAKIRQAVAKRVAPTPPVPSAPVADDVCLPRSDLEAVARCLASTGASPGLLALVTARLSEGAAR